MCYNIKKYVGENNMNSKERYKELIKENNETIKYLSNSYQSIAYTYIKKQEVMQLKVLIQKWK